MRASDQSVRSSPEVDGDLVVGDAFVPPGEGAPGGVLDDGLFGILACERAYRPPRPRRSGGPGLSALNDYLVEFTQQPLTAS